MNKFITGSAFLFAFSLNAQQTQPESAHALRIASGVVKGVTEKGVGSFKEIQNWAMYSAQTEQLLEFQTEATPVSKPDPKKKRLDLIEKAESSGILR